MIVSEIVERVVSHIIFTSYARNVCLQHERKHVDVGAMTPTAHYMNSVIQNVHSFLMRLHNFSTSEADIASMQCKDDVTFYTFNDFKTMTATCVCGYSMAD